MEFLVITGMSGAGKSQAMNVMEDMGYYCMDNLPPALLPKFAELSIESKKTIDKIAVVVDIRGGEFFHSLFQSLEELSNMDIGYKILFLDASDNTLIKRYKELRRPHPLNVDGSIVKGIEEEKKLMKELKSRAYYLIDTSELTLGKLKEQLYKIFSDSGEDRKLSIVISSFGFKYGILMDADLVFDVRFLPNPYYIPELKKISGINEETVDYVFKWPQTNIFINKTINMLDFLLPYYVDEGKTQLVIGIGCTGGFHRSVAIANHLGKLIKLKGHKVIVNHRELKEE